MNIWLDNFINSTTLAQNKPIREAVYDVLKEALISGDIPSGERIVEKELANRLKISRTPIRDAIKQLEDENLVESIPRVGVFAKSITKENIYEVYRIRESLEVLILQTSIENISENDITLLKSNIENTKLANKENNIKEIQRLFKEFNDLLYKSSKMKLLPSLINNLNSYLSAFRMISISDKERRTDAIKEHELILNCIINKDLKLGIETVRKHLDFSVDVVSNDNTFL